MPRVRHLRGRRARAPRRGLDRRQPALRRRRAADRGVPARLRGRPLRPSGSSSSSGSGSATRRCSRARPSSSRRSRATSRRRARRRALTAPGHGTPSVAGSRRGERPDSRQCARRQPTANASRSGCRVACVEERLSLETFVGRLELAYGARTRSELAALVADLGEPGPLGRALLAVARAHGPVARTGAGCMAAAADPAPAPGRRHGARRPVARVRRRPRRRVRRRGATRCCRREHRRWTVEDCGSRNGTWVNGRRVERVTSVRPGDLVTFADARYRLAAPRDQSSPRRRRIASSCRRGR